MVILRHQSLNPFSPASSTTTSNFNPSKATDGKFQIVPVTVPIPSPEGKPLPVTTADPGYTEEDVMMITDTICQIPVIIKPKLKPRTKEQMTPFNHQLFLYCVRKKINPFDHFFDEMGIVIAGMGLFGGIYQEYQVAYPKNGQKISPLDKDHEHKIAVDELNKKEGS